MSLYPSLEDMKMAQMATAQFEMRSQSVPAIAPSAPLPYPVSPHISASMYPALNDFMGLELTPEIIAANMPQYAVAVPQPQELYPTNTGMIAPLSGQSLGLLRAQVTHGVREVTLCKDVDGKVGLRVQAVNNGIFVSLVQKNSPAAKIGIRFGDQILQINGQDVAGYSMDKVHNIFKKCSVNGITVVVRDRPFERTVTLHKDSTGHIGFQFKNGKIIRLVEGSSAARNGLLTEHQLLEVNGQNVVGVKDKEITSIIEEGGNVITVTVIPSFLYEHMTKKMASSLLTGLMDHSIPNI